MNVPLNGFKAALAAGDRQLGLWVSLANAYTTEVCAGAGFDWLLLDAEHAPNDVRSLLAQLQAAAAYPVHVVARPPVGDTHVIKQYLDIGVTSLLVPMVETAQEAERLVRAVRYPPRGDRGVGAAVARASRWGRMEGYIHRAEDEICLLVQVESAAGLENLAAIAAVEGVDGVFIGPSDLSASLGRRGDPGHPEVQAAVARAFETIHAAGKPSGILSTHDQQLAGYRAMGAVFVAVGIDVLLLARATEALIARHRALESGDS